MTRIVSGSAGGRRLAVPPKGTRPTSERVREAMFSALESAVDLDGARVLDLYAGSGALGLEALSRGAASATFVETDRQALEVLRRNATTLGLPGAIVLPGTVESVLSNAPGQPFDVILADPPYRMPDADLAVVLARVATGGWLAEHGVLVLERAARDGEPTVPAGLSMIRTRRYGDTATHWIGVDAHPPG
ncbi:MAG TPA: 16S rRNA (guanine(966)-N(2))-methyltransferase RsmD [Pseudonocardiaceae bacterium]|jgi:16S rRNA (guanine966-N2)-methyltransferase|nr:16S rRNA (guanine(966)-N(2))-methyltransferase RsmD [Pseudonocardiaceae bacterium]